MHVARQLGFAVVKFVERNRFGLAVSAEDFSEFKEVAPGIFLPYRTHRLEERVSRETKIVTILKLNEPIPEHLLIIRVPAGTHIEDLRPHRNDAVDSNGNVAFDAQRYPLREFTTVAEDLDGLPTTVLAEMDRDVLSRDEWSQMNSGRKNSGRPGKQKVGPTKTITPASSSNKSSEPAAAASTTTNFPPAKAAKQAVDKALLRYGGKSFGEWRQTLLTDLEPDTRIKAINAFKVFGAVAYEDEIVATIRDVLKTDQSDLSDRSVQNAAFDLLSRMGAAGHCAVQAA